MIVQCGRGGQEKFKGGLLAFAFPLTGAGTGTQVFTEKVFIVEVLVLFRIVRLLLFFRALSPFNFSLSDNFFEYGIFAQFLVQEIGKF